MTQNHTSSRRRQRRIFVAAFLLILAGALSVVVLEHPPAWLYGFLGLVVLGLAVLIVHHARRTIYVCSACRHSFKISSWNDFVSPHLPDRKLLTCPRCRHTDWFPTIGNAVKTLENEDQPV